MSAGKCLVTLQHHDDKVMVDTTVFLLTSVYIGPKVVMAYQVNFPCAQHVGSISCLEVT